MTQPVSRSLNRRGHEAAGSDRPIHDRESDASTASSRRSSRSQPRLRVVGLLVLLLVMPPVLALGIATTRTPVHAARAELVYRIPPDSQRFDQEMRTQVSILGSPGLLQPTADAFDMPMEELQEALEVEQVDESEMLRITVRDSDEQRALGMAESVTDAYTERLTGGSVLDDQSQRLQRRLGRLRTRQAGVNERLSEVTAREIRRAADNDEQPRASARQLRLEGVAQALRDQIAELERRMTDYRIRELEGGPTVEVIAAPFVLADPVSPQPSRSLAAGLLIGVVLAGAALVGLRVLASRRPRDADVDHGR